MVTDSDSEVEPGGDRRRRRALWITFWIALVVLIGSLAIGGRLNVDSAPDPSGQSQSNPDPELTGAGASASATSTASPTASRSAAPRATGSAGPSAPAHPGGSGGSTSAGGKATGPSPTFAAVNGFGCPTSGSAGLREVGRYTDGRVGWYTISSGGWTGDGCNGSFDTIDMSGDSQDDPTAYAEFWFSVGAATRTCEIAVYVPSSGNAQDVAGHPTYYQVSDTEGGPVETTFAIDQLSNHGRWVNGPTVAATAGRLVIRLVNRGIDYTDAGPTFAHHAISQVRLVCQG
jgi:translation initiation factor IF-2